MTIARRVVTARKEHLCVDCRKLIRPGEQYVRRFGRAFDGDPAYAIAQCEACDAKVVENAP